MKKKILKILSIFLIMIMSENLYGNLLFDDEVPKELKNEISDLYMAKKIKNSFLFEVQGGTDLVIIAENGFIKSMPLAAVTAIDVLNVMEEMVEIVFEKPKDEKEGIGIETARDIKKVKKFSANESGNNGDNSQNYLKSGLVVADNVEFFPWVERGRRFNVSLFVTSEESWAGGANISAGLAFLRLGISLKKGADIVFAKNDKVPWESYGANIQFDLFLAYGSFVAVGFEVSLYRAMKKLFEREFFIFKTGYRYRWFEAAVSINVSPSVVELGLFGTKYTMERYNFVISAGVLF